MFEHVDDLDGSLAEVARVLRPRGQLLAIFPSREKIHEGHCGIPAVHWFRSNSALRAPYALLLHRLGLGFHKSLAPPQEWVRIQLEWLDRFVVCRRADEIRRSFERHFVVTPFEKALVAELIARRIQRWLAQAVQKSPWRVLTRILYRLAGGLVILARRRESPSARKVQEA